MFDPPGTFDESSVFYMFRDPSLRALDQSIKANKRLAHIQTQLAHSAAQAQSPADGEARIRELEQRCLALGLYAQALAQLLVAKGIATSDEIREAIVEVDLLDGKLDGR